MTRSRIALSMLMIVYVLSLLAVGQAEDHRKRRVTGKSPSPLAMPAGEASSSAALPVDSFTYYGPDDEELLAAPAESAPYEVPATYADAAELAETAERLLGSDRLTPSTGDEFVDALNASDAEFVRDLQANENLAPLPPDEIAEMHPAAPNPELVAEPLGDEFAVDNALEATDLDVATETTAPVVDMHLTVDSVLFDTLGQDLDADERFYVQQPSAAPSPATPLDTCPHFSHSTQGIRCPLIDECRELMSQWRRESLAPPLTVEPTVSASHLLDRETEVRNDIEDDGMYTAEFGPAFDERDNRLLPIPSQSSWKFPEVYGLDCDPLLVESLKGHPSVASSKNEVRWEGEDLSAFEFHGAPSSVSRLKTSTSIHEYVDDESQWDCHLADPANQPVQSVLPVKEPTLAKKPMPAAKKNEPTLAPPRSKKLASLFWSDRTELARLWTVSLADRLQDTSWNEGTEIAWFINVENDGLTRTPRVDRYSPVLDLLVHGWQLLAPVADRVVRQIDQARGPAYADYGYPWDEEALPGRALYHDLNLELEF